MDLVAGIAVYKYVMPCHDCGIYSKHLWTLYHDACETICLHSIVMLYLYIMYLYGLWPEIKSYYYYYDLNNIYIKCYFDMTKCNMAIRSCPCILCY